MIVFPKYGDETVFVANWLLRFRKQESYNAIREALQSAAKDPDCVYDDEDDPLNGQPIYDGAGSISQFQERDEGNAACELEYLFCTEVGELFGRGLGELYNVDEWPLFVEALGSDSDEYALSALVQPFLAQVSWLAVSKLLVERLAAEEDSLRSDAPQLAVVG